MDSQSSQTWFLKSDSAFGGRRDGPQVVAPSPKALVKGKELLVVVLVENWNRAAAC